MRIIPALAFCRLIYLLVPGLVVDTGLNAQRTSTGAANSSNELLTDVLGRPVYLKVTYNMEGSPFYPTEYTKADIYIKSGKVYPSIATRFNMEENTLLLKLDDGNELVVTTPVPRIVFRDTGLNGQMLGVVFENGFPAADKQTTSTYYQVVDSGKIKLLRYYSVTYLDKKEYGQASITRIYDMKETWYMFLPDKTMHKLEKGKEAFLALIPDRKEDVRQYIDQKGYKCKKEEEWKDVLRYYNSLPVN